MAIEPSPTADATRGAEPAVRHSGGDQDAAGVIWSRLHGLVSLEIAGNFASMGVDPAQVFEAQLPTLTA